MLFTMASYLVTKGKDGSLSGFYMWFSSILVAHTVTSAFHQTSPVRLVLELVVYEACAMAVLRTTQLDEMAGMLYLFIPAAIGLTVLVEPIAQWLFSNVHDVNA